MAKRKRRPSTYKQIVVVSDPHCGSVFGLCPPNLDPLPNGEIYSLTPDQEWIWQCWTHHLKEVRRRTAGDPFILLINGDVVEGVHHHDKQQVYTDASVHSEIAIKALSPLAKHCLDTGGKIFVTKGTEIHSGEAEHTVGYVLGATVCPWTKRYAADHWQIDLNGLRVSASHHMGCSAREWTSMSGLGIAGAQEQLVKARRLGWIPDIIIRSHRHKWGIAMEEGVIVVASPAWKTLDRYTHKAVPGEVPVVGSIHIDARHLESRDVPYVTPIRYTFSEYIDAHRIS